MLWLKTDDKEHWFNSIRAALIHCQEKYHTLPTKIHMNPNEIAIIGKAKGVTFRGNNISVKEHTMCLLKHIELHI